VAIGLCVLVIASYFQPFEVHQAYGLHYPTTVYCSLQKWWWAECRGRFYGAAFEIVAVITFAAAASIYLDRPRS
jgi:hypothetical protein